MMSEEVSTAASERASERHAVTFWRNPLLSLTSKVPILTGFNMLEHDAETILREIWRFDIIPYYRSPLIMRSVARAALTAR